MFKLFQHKSSHRILLMLMITGCLVVTSVLYGCKTYSIRDRQGRAEQRTVSGQGNDQTYQIRDRQGRAEQRTVRSQGIDRTYRLYTPASYDADTAQPLVIVFHGGHGTGSELGNRIGMDEIADREAFLTSFPDAAGDRHWNDGRPTTKSGVDDKAFVRAMIDDIKRYRNIDTDRVYVAGISNGGSFVARLACELSDQFAAYAQVASTMSVELASSCKPSVPVSIMMINGTDDPLVRWEGGELRKSGKMGKGGKVIGVEQAINFWASHDKCNNPPDRTMLDDRDLTDGTRVKKEQYKKCLAHTEVVLLEVEGGGHTWPGSTEIKRIKRIVGNTSYDINASEELWKFFSRHSLR